MERKVFRALVCGICGITFYTGGLAAAAVLLEQWAYLVAALGAVVLLRGCSSGRQPEGARRTAVHSGRRGAFSPGHILRLGWRPQLLVFPDRRRCADDRRSFRQQLKTERKEEMS